MRQRSDGSRDVVKEIMKFYMDNGTMGAPCIEAAKMEADTTPLPQIVPDLSGRVVLITGTTSGLGARFARLLAKAGAAVALTGRRADRLECARKDILAAGGKSAAFKLDMLSANDIQRVAAEVETALGPVDTLINNAGISVPGPAVNLAEGDFNRVWQTNVSGAFFMTQHIARRMIERGQGGRIINIASTGAHTAVTGQAAYCISKAALLMMTQSLAKELAPYNINVNALCPGAIRTEINDEWLQTDFAQTWINSFPRRRVGAASDLDDLILLLSSGRSRLLTGAAITVDDGQSL
jgi:NAD(P)-dependent dehydrogenase (short-subunit alcohol dehydrogenase family)